MITCNETSTELPRKCLGFLDNTHESLDNISIDRYNTTIHKMGVPASHGFRDSDGSVRLPQ